MQDKKSVDQEANDAAPEDNSPEQEQRRETRLEALRGSVEIDGRFYPVKDWSVNGFLITSYSAPQVKGDRLNIKFTLPLPQGKLEFECEAIAVRVDEERNELAAVFVKLDGETRLAIAESFE